MKIAIAGRKSLTGNYIRLVRSIGATPLVTLSTGEISTCDGLILPGGGDITPAFFGELNHGSTNIDTELDILQLQALELCLRTCKPVLGICKGMQLINVGLGGTILQSLPTSQLHKYNDGDSYHITVISDNTWLSSLYGTAMTVNSAHHQALGRLGNGLSIIQICPFDNCPEAISHQTLPILGVQWHPERLNFDRSGASGKKVFLYFASLISLSLQ